MTNLVTGDTGSILEVTVKDKTTGAVVNLTGASVRFFWRDNEGTLQNVVATVTNAAGGVVSHQFTAGQIIAPEMRVEVQVTDSLGNTTTGVDPVELVVREQIG